MKIVCTSAMRLGSLAHLAILEPELMATNVAVMPQCDRRTKAGKEEYAKALEDAEAEGKQLVTASDYATVTAMKRAVKHSRHHDHC